MFKPIFLSLAVLFTTSASIGQSFTLINKTASNKNSRILYIGLDNNLEIKDETFKGIEPHDGVLLEQNQLTIRPVKPGKLTITFLTTEGKVPVTFTVKYVSDIIVTINGQPNKGISKDILLREGQLSLIPADNKDTLFDGYKIVSCTAQLNGKTFEITEKDFSSDLLAAIRNTQIGDILTISAVKAFNEAIGMTGKFDRKYSFELE
jgi:hypothetical protein